MDEQQRDEIAAFRWQLIAPVVAEDVTARTAADSAANRPPAPPDSAQRQDPGQRSHFGALDRRLPAGRLRRVKPKVRDDARKGRVITPEILEHAIAARRKCRSAARAADH